MKAAFYTLGCKVNQYDTQVMTESLIQNGYEIVTSNDVADIYIINTCTVTAVADSKCRKLISRSKRANPAAIVIVCGCYAQTAPLVISAIEGVDILIGTHNRIHLVNYINQFLANRKNIIDVSDKPHNLTREQISDFADKTRAILKIEDGCENYCSYCIIPKARGKIVSKPLGTILSEVKKLSEAGYFEIVLTGIHLASYGKDLKDTTLIDAIKTVAEINDIIRIRLGSLEPRIITGDFVAELKSIHKLCHNFHLSLQSGANSVLQRMNRKYTTAEYLNAVNFLRNTFNDCMLSTDIIVGFPCETEQEFSQTVEFVKEVGFAKIHIFPFSPRPGTKAANMFGQISKSVKEQRVKTLEKAAAGSRLAFLKSYIGQKVEVLVESWQNGICIGYTANYINAAFPSNSDLSGKLINIRILQVENDRLFGKIF